MDRLFLQRPTGSANLNFICKLNSKKSAMILFESFRAEVYRSADIATPAKPSFETFPNNF